MRAIDGFFRDHLHPVLKRAGFQRRGRRAFLSSAAGDLAMVEVKTFPTAPDSLGFWMKAALFPTPWLDLARWMGRTWFDVAGLPAWTEGGLWHRQIDPSLTSVRARVNPAVQPWSLWWDVTTSSTEVWGEVLRETLDHSLLPFLTRMLDRSELLAAVLREEVSISATAKVTLLADDGRTRELAQEVAQVGPLVPGGRHVMEWLASRLPYADHAELDTFAGWIHEFRSRQHPRLVAAITNAGVTDDGQSYVVIDDPDWFREYVAAIDVHDGTTFETIIGPQQTVRVDGQLRNVLLAPQVDDAARLIGARVTIQ